MKVLIVDDNKANLSLLKSIFESQGWEVRESENGKSALEKARAQPPDLIVSDILLQKKMSDLEKSNQSLQTLNEELEQRITKQTTQLAMTNKELESLIYSVSHDLRAPLRTIDGFIQILMEDYAEKLDNQGKDYLDRVHRAARHMDRLIEDLLKLSRVTQSEFQDKKVSLSDLVKKIAGICRQNSPQQMVDLLVQDGVWVHGDANLLRIALTNLLENAWKFTGRVVHPRIEFGAIIKDGSSIYYIRDNGAGFDRTHADKLFGVFQRFHSSEEFPGTGIGLATVKRIIDRHGGRIWAESEMQKGTTFYFTL